ncbi:MAG TPA: ABC-F family ATP-binding cassette domain-containing protein [Candidatus Limnocylindria bacterium]|nr:ABC-F family ATP-binding cassette domain-containing protein [Candidatus Limnocylindria bacterium]
MSVLSVQAVARWYGQRELLKDVSFRIGHGDRVGLVGPNGTGKTSLLRIAAGLDAPDAGAVAYARGTRLGFLRQELLEDATGTVVEHARGAAAHLRELERELRALESDVASGDPETLERYADAQHRFEHAGGYDFDARLARILGGLGLGGLVDREVATLSGGERTRLGLARLLLDDPDVLLLDEPTNHLDVAALEWLERFLVEQDETCLISSHDRWFLDRVTSRTLSIEDLTVVEYRGAYSHYARQRADREAAQMRASAKQAEEIARTEEFIRRYGAGQRSKEARGRGKKLARLERIEAPTRSTRHTWELAAADLGSETVLETTALSVGYGEPVMRTGPLRVPRDSRIAIVGPNGAGKTTLVRTLVGDLGPLAGYVSAAPAARVAYLEQAQAELTGEQTVLEALRSAGRLTDQEARDLLARFLFRGEEVDRAVGVLSGGERSRLALARLSLRHANLLVLDEPTNHLDLAAREQLEAVLDSYEGTLVFVSHDRYFIDKLSTELWLIGGGLLRRWEGNWSSYQRERAAGRDAPIVEFVQREQGAAEAPRAPAREGSPSQRDGVSRGEGVSAPRPPDANAPSPDRTRPAIRRNARASEVRRVSGLRALEARIAAMELQLKQLTEKVAQIAQSGNYLETRRVGEEHAALERSLKELYDEWAKASEAEKE